MMKKSEMHVHSGLICVMQKRYIVGCSVIGSDFSFGCYVMHEIMKGGRTCTHGLGVLASVVLHDQTL